MKRFTLIFFLALLCFSQTPETVIQKAEETLASLNTFQADFEQILHSSSVATPLKEKGIIRFKKPDSMKWEYREPERKIFLTENGIYQFYIPDDNQLYRGSINREGHEGEILFILSGQRKINKSYVIEPLSFPTDGKNVDQFKLTPKSEEDYSHLFLEIQSRTGLIRKIIFFDWAGNKQEISFKRIKTNLRLPKDSFELEIPSDVEIIEYRPQ
jgi:outer membrane lipoprotein-sorting protein